MNNRFGLSPNFRIEREQRAMNIETVTARIYNPWESRLHCGYSSGRPTGVLDASRLNLDGPNLANSGSPALRQGLMMNYIL